MDQDQVSNTIYSPQQFSEDFSFFLVCDIKFENTIVFQGIKILKF